jgi:type II secretory pathway pseudopilin PulG
VDRNARGFTLLETVVALGIAVALGWLAVTVGAHVLRAGRIQAARDSAQSTLLQLSDDLATEEDDAWAIYVPPSDVLGAPNSDGHEVDFFARDSEQQPYFWAYNYNAGAHIVTRYRFSAPSGSTPVTDVTFSGVTQFSAHTYPVTALQDSTTPIYSTLYRGASLQSGIVHFYPSMPWIAGGNNITYVSLAAGGYQRSLQLVTQTAPSGFTIVLNYTPTPSPSGSPGLTVWPAAIRFPVSGAAIAYVNHSPPTFAQRLNALLGGSVALAAGGCGTNVAQAFATSQDMANDVPLANATDPYDASVTTDGNGCMSTSVISLNEPGSTSQFIDYSGELNACLTSNVNETTWIPSSYGPTASQNVSGSTTGTTGCSLGFMGNNSLTAIAIAQVVEPCWVIGGACTLDVSFPDDGPGCAANEGTYTDGYTGSGRVSASYGSISPTTVGTGPFTYTRTSSGTDTLGEYAQYVSYSISSSGGHNICKQTVSFHYVGSLTIPSV